MPRKMPKSTNYQFSNHAFGQYGTMICQCCNEKIVFGDFIYAVKNLPHNDWMFVTWHRNCSGFVDWNSEDRKRMNEINSLESELRKLLNAKNQLKNYDSIVDEIDYEIENLENKIEQLKEIYFPKKDEETIEE